VTEPEALNEFKICFLCPHQTIKLRIHSFYGEGGALGVFVGVGTPTSGCQ
jgi:hypothetical protein